MKLKSDPIPFPLSEWVLPNYDPSLCGKFEGNHSEFRVLIIREGDTVTIRKSHRLRFNVWNVHTDVFTLDEIKAKISFASEDFDLSFELVDDLPEGNHLPVSNFGGAESARVR